MHGAADARGRHRRLRPTAGHGAARIAATLPESVLLEHSRLRAWIEPDRLLPGAYQLIVDGTPQSHVNTLDPTDLTYEYVRRMAHVIDLMRPPGLALTAVHLGAGALTLPRYVEATRPGSRQQVIELEERLVELVRQSLPWHPASIRVRYGDARATLGRLPAGLRGTADLVVVDVFRGARTPAHVTSREFYAEVKTLLAQGGVVLVNVADGPPLRFARAQAATVQSVFTAACALAENSVLKGRRFGNIVIAASDAALPLAGLPRLLASGAYPAKAVVGAEFARFAAAPVTTDSNAVPSPEPGHLFGG